MKKQPLVSIIMNCYNGEKYLTDSLNSIINQKYKNWELIFWDNVSNDNSKSIFSLYKSEKRFKYFRSSKHLNLYAARNLALKKIKGDIVTFIDADDIWLDTKLKKQIAYFIKNKTINFLYSNYFKQKKFLFFNIKKKKFKNKLPEGFISNDLFKSYSVGWVTVAIKAKELLYIKKPFNENIDMISDYDFVINYSLKKKIGCLQEPLAIYREHPDQISRKKFYQQAMHFIFWFNNIIKKKKVKKFRNFSYLKKKYNFFSIIIDIKNIDFFYKKIKYVMKIKNFKIKIKALLFIILGEFFLKHILSTS